MVENVLWVVVGVGVLIMIVGLVVRKRQTEARLNSLIGVVERLASGEGGNPGA